MDRKGALENPWQLILTRPHMSEMALAFKDPQKRALWSKALFEGGNTLRLWNDSPDFKTALITACALKKGQNVLVIGKYGEESKLVPAIRSVAGSPNTIVHDVFPRAMEALDSFSSSPAGSLSWDFNYLDAIKDQSVDRLILFNAVSHVRAWKDFALEIDRVLKPGGRLIIAESPWGGRELLKAARLDGHLYGVLALALGGMGMKESDLAVIGPEDLSAMLGPFLSRMRSFMWQGMYLFYGDKGGNEIFPVDFPDATPEVREFIDGRTSDSPWSLLSAAEVRALGDEVAGTEAQKTLGRVCQFGPGLDFTYLKYQDLVSLMYSKLKVAPGSRVLVIGEVLEGLGFVREMRKRVGDSGEIDAQEISGIHQEMFKRLWQGQQIPQRKRHQYEYTFADKYPDNYFDLVWFPQGVHHAVSWKETAPRVLRVLKPGGQVMMIESRICDPDFFTAVQMSGLMKCMAEKLWWALGVTFEEMPDYSTESLKEAFGDSLSDTFGIDPEGWLVFWGFKK